MLGRMLLMLMLLYGPMRHPVGCSQTLSISYTRHAVGFQLRYVRRAAAAIEWRRFVSYVTPAITFDNKTLTLHADERSIAHFNNRSL